MRKKLLFVFICVALLLQLLPAPAAKAISDGDSSILRVKLSIGSVTSFSFTTHGSYSAGSKTLSNDATYTAKVSGSSVKLYKGSTAVTSGTSVYIGQASGTGNTVSLHNSVYGTRSYQGDLKFSVNSSGKLMLVNYIDLEQYLYGVVPYEMSDSWPREALKAQAVAARNYTVKCMGSSGSYDLTDLSSQDQVYRGYNSSYKNAIAAVNATAGQVMKSGNTIINAYYSASNGGWTELPYHRWGGGASWTYYRVVYDPYDIANSSSRYQTITLPVVIDDGHPVTAKTNCDGTINCGNAVKLIKKAILDSGKLSGVKSTGDFTLTGVTDLYTQTYDTGSSQDHRRTQDLDGDGKEDPNLCMDKVRATGAFTVSVNGTPAAVTDIDLDLRELKSGGSYPAFFSASLGLFVAEPVYDSEGAVKAFNLSMRRFGHALGLSQRGAQQRSKSVADGGAGQTYDQILQFYYPGVTIQTLHLVNPKYKVTSVSLDRADVKMLSGRKLTLTATVTPSNAQDKSVSWTSDNEAAAAVSEGVVTAVSDGTANITVKTTDGGYTASCAVTVRTSAVISDVYTVDFETITDVKDNTPVASFLANFGNDPANLRVYKADGTELESGSVGTGMTLALFKDGAEAERMTIIVLGDANGDGKISISDYTLARLDILGIKALAGYMRAGADVNKDGKISISDYTLMRLDILGLKKIN